MVRAIRSGRKTQTRREIKHTPDDDCPYHENGVAIGCPYGKVGDRLWVKETHLPKASGIIYRADFESVEAAGIGAMYGGWKPSIFCNRIYSRINLEIVAIRIERLKDISNEDCFAEGLPADTTKGNRTWYGDLWEEINGKGSWDANPWVWVVTFKEVFNAALSESAREQSKP